MTHLYTLLVGGTILPGVDEPPATALAYAEDVVLAIGSDEDIHAISRGDSTVVDLDGAFVVPIGAEGGPAWPPPVTLEVGGPADFAILATDPRSDRNAGPPVGLVRAGHLLSGSLGP